MNFKTYQVMLIILSMFLAFASGYETEFEFCTSNRHVHLSSGRDASTSVIVSFSSHPCDIGEHNLIGDRRLLKNSNHSARNQYNTYEHLKPSRGGVILSTNRDDVVSDSSDHAIMIDNKDDSTGMIRRYNATIIMKKERIDYWSEYQHHVVVTGLEPNTKYYYKCVVAAGTLTSDDHGNDNDDDDYYNDGENHESAYEDYYRTRKTQTENNNNHTHKSTNDSGNKIFSFQTSPSKSNESGRTTKFAVIGDLGVFDHTRESLQSMKKHSDAIDFVILAGDIAYGNGDYR